MAKETLFDFLKTNAVSGYEEAFSDIIFYKMKALIDKVEKDDLGNVIGYLGTGSPLRLLLVAHMDEIGLMVTGIDADGMIRVVKLGEIYPVSYLGQKVRIFTKSGVIYGTVAISRRVSMYKELEGNDLLIDIGGTSREEVISCVSIGDIVILDTDYRELKNNCLTGRGLDNKIGIYVILETLEKIIKRGVSISVCIAATVGEETSKNGAYWVAQKINPDISITIDATYSNDYRYADFDNGNMIKVGGGPVICHAPIISKKINKRLVECASNLGISIQEECAGGKIGSDIDMIHKSGKGVSTSILSIPVRYMHSSSEVACITDANQCVDLLTEYICTLNE